MDVTPCPGNGTCCDRSLFDRTIFPCSVADRLARLERLAANPPLPSSPPAPRRKGPP